MLVVKLGGSLYSSPFLQEWADALGAQKNQQVIVVSGGGPFADQVRGASKTWKISDHIAHNMAVLAMQQYAYLITSLNKNLEILESIDSLKNKPKNNSMVWLPYNDVINKLTYPKTWQVTSDSLALWLANYLSAKKLCLIKSVLLQDQTSEEAASSDIVDEYFSKEVQNYQGEVNFYHASESAKFLADVSHGQL